MREREREKSLLQPVYVCVRVTMCVFVCEKSAADCVCV